VEDNLNIFKMEDDLKWKTTLIFSQMEDDLIFSPGRTLWEPLCVYLCVCVSVYLLCVFSVFRIVDQTSTEASLAPVIDQL
jgi:hypothetical protein